MTDRPPTHAEAARSATRREPGSGTGCRWRLTPSWLPAVQRASATAVQREPQPRAPRVVQAGPDAAACPAASAASHRFPDAMPAHPPVRATASLPSPPDTPYSVPPSALHPPRTGTSAAWPSSARAPPRPQRAIAGNAGTASTSGTSLRDAGNRAMTPPQLPRQRRSRLHCGSAAEGGPTAADWVTSAG